MAGGKPFAPVKLTFFGKRDLVAGLVEGNFTLGMTTRRSRLNKISLGRCFLNEINHKKQNHFCYCSFPISKQNNNQLESRQQVTVSTLCADISYFANYENPRQIIEYF